MSDSERPVDFGADDDDSSEKKRLFERAVPEVIKRIIERAVETGVEKLVEAPENLRDLVADLKLPKEAAHLFYDQIDDTKKGVYRVVAKEIRDVLEHVNLAEEIATVLTKLQFEINTTIRFVPNTHDEEAQPEGEAAAAGTPRTPGSAEGEEEKPKRPSLIPRPQVVSKVVMKAKEALKPRE